MVDEYFSSNKLNTTGGFSLYFKAILLFFGFAFLYYLLVFTNIPALGKIGICFLLGFDIASIGFNVMHDGAHGSYSKKSWINNFMGYSLNFLGGNVYLWKFKHNIMHHTFTNVEDQDEDIDIRPLMRTNESQPLKWFHQYQYIYWVILYTQMYFWWVYVKDFAKYFSGKIGTRVYPKMSQSEHIIFWSSKFIHLFIFAFFPIYYLSFTEWLIGFVIIMVVTGLTIGIVFQLAHVVPVAEFPLPNKDNKIENNWMIHQLETTVNFSPNNKLISWYVGGLNFQVEHHLFPRISHVHYPKIRLMVRELCAKMNIPYLEYPTMLTALKAHVSYLKQMGRQR